MTHGSLFSGIGGFDLAAEWMGWENKFHCEIDPFCQKLLKKHFPNSISHEDIRATDFTIYRRKIDVLSGGFPCKQTSVGASIHGSRTGLAGKDSGLWFEFLRVIREIIPNVAVIENVQGVEKWENTIQSGLEESGYTVSKLSQQACFYGLPHSRRRNIYVAYRDLKRLSFTRQTESPSTEWYERLAASGGSWLDHTPGISRGINGIPHRMDRIIALGNAIVPQVAYQIFKAIEQCQ